MSCGVSRTLCDTHAQNAVVYGMLQILTLCAAPASTVQHTVIDFGCDFLGYHVIGWALPFFGDRPPVHFNPKYNSTKFNSKLSLRESRTESVQLQSDLIRLKSEVNTP